MGSRAEMPQSMVMMSWAPASMSSTMAVSDGRTEYYLEAAPIPPPAVVATAPCAGSSPSGASLGFTSPAPGSAVARTRERARPQARPGRILSTGWVFALAALASFGFVIGFSTLLRALQ